MMLNFGASGGVGIDVGAARLCAVAIDRSGRVSQEIAIERRDHGPTPSVDDLSRLSSAMRRRGMPRDQAWSVAPKAVLRMQSLSLPPESSGAPLDQLARAEIMRITQAESPEFELAWWSAPTPHKHETRQATTIVLNHDDAHQMIDAFGRAGIGLRGAIAPAYALSRGLESELASSAVGVVLDVGWSRTSLIATVNGAPAYERHIKMCFSELVDRLGKRLELDVRSTATVISKGAELEGQLGDVVGDALRRFGERLMDEVGESLGYLRSLWPEDDFGAFALVGGGATAPGLDDWLTASTGMMVFTPSQSSPTAAAALGAAREAAGLQRRAAA